MAGKQIRNFLTQAFPCPIYCMKQTNPTFLVIGLADGQLCVWNTQTNAFNFTKPHLCGVTALDICLINGF
jgi:hypothetical protein